MLTVKEAAERLGLVEATIRLWLARRKITYIRLGSRAIRIPEAEIERLIAEGTITARPRTK